MNTRPVQSSASVIQGWISPLRARRFGWSHTARLCLRLPLALVLLALQAAALSLHAQCDCPVPIVTFTTNLDNDVLSACNPSGTFGGCPVVTNEECMNIPAPDWQVDGPGLKYVKWEVVNYGWGVNVTLTGNPQPSEVTVKGTGQWSWYCWCTNGGPYPYTLEHTFKIEGTGGGCSSGGCGGPTPGPPTQNPPPQNPPLDKVDVDNNLGPYLTFHLGPLSSQQDGGILALYARTTTGSLSSPAALSTPILGTAPGSSVDVVTNGGVIQQVRPPQGLINVVTQTPTKYCLQFFYNSNVGTKSGGSYPTNGSAFDVWTIDGSAGTNQLVVTQAPAGQPSRSFTYIYTSVNGVGQWQMTDSAGLATVASWQTTNAITGAYSTFRQVLSGTAIVQMTQKDFIVLDGLPMLSRQIDGAGTVTNITAYTYNSDDRVQEIDYPGGNWVYYEYDTDGRVVTKYSAYGNSPSPASTGLAPDPSSCKMVTYSYSRAPDDGIPYAGGLYRPTMARTETTYLPAAGSFTNVSVIYRSAPSALEVEEWRCPDSNPYFGNPTNLLTTTMYYPDPTGWAGSGRISWQVLPDGTATIYTYNLDTNGALVSIVSQTGQPDDPVDPSTILEGTQTTQTFNSWGQITSTTAHYITGGAVSAILSQQTNYYSGPLQLDCTSVDLANRTNKFQYACCGLDSVTDPDGVMTVYNYDGLKRRTASTVVRGNTVTLYTNILDAAGRVLVSQRIADTTVSLAQYQYDALGRIIRQTNALGGVTTTTNVLVNGRLCVTNTYPDGGTRIELYYADGTLQSLSGTAVALAQYSHGTVQDGDNWRRFTLTAKPNSVGATNEWTSVYANGAGRAYKTVYAGSSTNPYEIAYFNASGQLTNRVDADGVSTLYAYNPRGEQILTVLDLNQDYNTDFAGSDRITFTTNDVVTDHGTTALRTRTYVWGIDRTDASNLVSTVERSADGLRTWSTTWNSGNAITSQAITVYTNGYRYTTNITPDNSYSMSTYQYGQLLSLARFDANNGPLGQTWYGYDAHGRQSAITDARNGTTSYTFNNADQVVTATTPQPALGQPAQTTIAYYDTCLRLWKITQPDGTSVTNVYKPTGALLQTSGSRTYPVAYTYDGQGRITTMKTWQNFAGNGGTAITTWNYDAYRGWLVNKRYQDNTGPDYTYTPGGRLSTRTWARAGTDSQRIVTTYTYGFNDSLAGNESGDLVQVTYSSNDPQSTPAVSYKYDRLGRQSTVLRNGIATALLYNDAGQLLCETNSGGVLDQLAVSHAYDNLLRRTNLTAQYSTTPILHDSFSYDPASRLKTVTDNSGATPYSATYSYLANSPLVGQIVFANNGTTVMTTTKQCDFLNRLTQISSVSSAQSVVSFAYQYNAANQRVRAILADGSYWLYTYNPLGQVIDGSKYWPDGTPVAGQQFQYCFDDIGNRTSTQAGGDQNGAKLRSASYTANTLNQYSSRTVPGAFDITGLEFATNTVLVNGTAASRKGEYFRQEVNVDNSSAPVCQSVSVTATNETTVNGNQFVPQTPEQFTYDLDGNLLSDGRWNYTWDAENRLVGMAAKNTSPPVGPQVSLKFDYDWKGRRTHKQVWGNPTWNGNLTNNVLFVYDGWNSIAELNATNDAVVESYLWGLDLSGSEQGAGGVGALLEITDAAAGVHFAAYDGNGNIANLVNAGTGASSATYGYGPFAEIHRATSPMAKTNPFGFSTKHQDHETDLLYYGYRYYNPSTGRWISRDPLGDLAFVSTPTVRDVQLSNESDYSFAANDPLRRVDFLGMNCIDPCGFAQTVGYDGGDPSGVICCMGKKYICIWKPGGQTGARNSKAQDIISRCLLVHEMYHVIFDIDCPLCSLWPTREPFKNPSAAQTDECEAYKLQLKCLQDANIRNDCGTDVTCQRELHLEIIATVRKRNAYCNF